MARMLVRCALLLLAAAALAAPARAQVRVVKFVKGPTVLLAPDTLAGSVEVGLWYAAGTRNDPPGASGLGYVVGRPLVHPVPDAERALTGMGGAFSEILTPDLTAGSLTLPPDLVLDGITALSARVGGAALSAASLSAALDRASIDRDERLSSNPMMPAIEGVFESGYAGHGYAAPVMGRPGDAARITLAAARADLAARFAPTRALLTVVGRFDPAEALARLGARFGESAPARPASPAARAPAFRPSTGAVKRVPVAFPLPVTLMGWRGPAVTDPGFPAFDLLSHLLVGGSLPFAPAMLVTPGGPYAQVLGGVDRRTDASMLFLVAVSGGDTTSMVDSLAGSVERLAHDGVPGDEVNRARQSLEGVMLKPLQTTEGRATALASGLLLEGDWNAWSKRIERIRGASPEQVQAAATRYLDPTHRFVVWTAAVETGGTEGGKP